MDDFEALQDRLTRLHPTLPPQLRNAATYLLDNPGEIATQSMRTVASQSGVPLANFARLAQAVGFETYNDLRDVYRRSVQLTGAKGYPERAAKLQASGKAGGDSAAAVGPSGDLLGYYDKIHLAQYGASMEKDYFGRGASLFCPPWADETRTPVAFADHDEQFLRLRVERAEIAQARRHYSFLADRLGDYDLPVTFARAEDPAGEEKAFESCEEIDV